MCFVFLILCCACSKEPTSSEGLVPTRIRLVVYSPHGPEVLGDYKKRFEAAYPEVEIQYLDMGSQEVYNRLRSERRRPYADIWWGGPSYLFAQAAREGLLESYEPTWKEHIRPADHDPQHFWYGTYRSPLGIVFNTRYYSKEFVPQNWDDLILPNWKGKIVFRKPQGSGTMRAFVCAMILRSSDEQAGLSWLKKLHENTAAYFENPQLLFDHLKRREDSITVWLWSDVVLQRERNGYPLDCIIPAQTIVLTEGIGIVKGTRHLEWAKRFYEFVTSAESLIHQAHAYSKIPARTDIDPTLLPSWMNELEVDGMTIDWDIVSYRQGTWLQLWEREVFQIQ